jgi:formate--tetrahydrofolate ligase
MNKDQEIAHRITLKPIEEIADSAGIPRHHLELYGRSKAKINLDILNGLDTKNDGKLILVSAITPTPAGEGKTTVSIGLNLALNQIGLRSTNALREPSMGPLFGVKGGATGGGWSQVLPMEDINLHFTGDIHAISAAHNLLAALVDNHLSRRKTPLLDPRRIRWPRVMDMNDRSLRDITVGLGGHDNGVPRETGFHITAASEIMAILCLSMGYEELKSRIGNIHLGFTYDNEIVFTHDLKIQGAVAALLRDALKPNLVQTSENTPAFVHGGPFANIAQGTNSIIATRLALKLFDIVVTEAGFGFDVGAEKFFDIVARHAGFCPAGVVLVATGRALKMHGGKRLIDIKNPDPEALIKGLPNLEKHLENIGKFGMQAVVAVNRFVTDTPEELQIIVDFCRQKGYKAAIVDCWEQGGKGAIELAEMVQDECRHPICHRYLYPLNIPIEKKIEIVAREIYGSKAIDFTSQAKQDLIKIRKYGFDGLPICIAKTQKSLSDNPDLLGRPKDFLVTVRKINISSGAGFVVPITGEILLMPGLPENPAAESIDLAPDGTISGLF